MMVDLSIKHQYKAPLLKITNKNFSLIPVHCCVLSFTKFQEKKNSKKLQNEKEYETKKMLWYFVEF